jgi:hypothetical protein
MGANVQKARGHNIYEPLPIVYLPAGRQVAYCLLFLFRVGYYINHQLMPQNSGVQVDQLFQQPG